MGFADRYIGALGASNLMDDERHHQAEPLMAAGLASAIGGIGPLLHRAKFAGTGARDLAQAVAARTRAEKDLLEAVRAKEIDREAQCRQVLAGDSVSFQSRAAGISHLLREWTAEVTKRGRARRWVPENTAWDAEAARKLFCTVAEVSLAHWLDGTCKCCAGTGKAQMSQCRPCDGTGHAPIEVAGTFVLERTKDMVSELQNIADSHSSRAQAKLRIAA